MGFREIDYINCIWGESSGYEFCHNDSILDEVKETVEKINKARAYEVRDLFDRVLVDGMYYIRKYFKHWDDDFFKIENITPLSTKGNLEEPLIRFTKEEFHEILKKKLESTESLYATFPWILEELVEDYDYEGYCINKIISVDYICNIAREKYNGGFVSADILCVIDGKIYLFDEEVIGFGVLCQNYGPAIKENMQFMLKKVCYQDIEYTEKLKTDESNFWNIDLNHVSYLEEENLFE